MHLTLSLQTDQNKISFKNNLHQDLGQERKKPPKLRCTMSAIYRSAARTLACRSIRWPLSLSHSSRKRPPLTNTNTNANITSGGGNSALNSPAKPMVYNSNIRGSGSDPRSQLTCEQKKEVDEHNRLFSKNCSRRTTDVGRQLGNKYLTGSYKC
jgi:hypothetical protein